MDIVFRIGARGSPLSLMQTAGVQRALAGRLQVSLEALPITPITTTGDRIQDRRLLEAGGKGLFTKELDEALREGRIDLAVHSLKDLPTRLPEGIALVATPPREDPRDAFISPIATRLEALPHGARLATASLRRQAQALAARGDLQISVLRGNIDTRLRKLSEGAADATFLAIAGLKRLGLAEHARSLLDPETFPPAAGQGALAITARADDSRARAACAMIHHDETGMEAAAERAALDALDGSCRTAIGAYAKAGPKGLRLIVEALSADGQNRWRRAETIANADPLAARALGLALGAEIRAEAGDALSLPADSLG